MGVLGTLRVSWLLRSNQLRGIHSKVPRSFSNPRLTIVICSSRSHSHTPHTTPEIEIERGQALAALVAYGYLLSEYNISLLKLAIMGITLGALESTNYGGALRESLLAKAAAFGDGNKK